MTNSEEYYIQHVASGFVGNSLMWWRKSRNGYTPDLKQAGKFNPKEAQAIENLRPPEDLAWRVDIVDNFVQYHVDMQDLPKILVAMALHSTQPSSSGTPPAPCACRGQGAA